MTRTQTHLLTAALCFYAFTTLISMAVMSVGAGVLVLGALIAFGGPIELARKIREAASHRILRVYLGVSVALALACAISLLIGRASPMGYGDKFVQIHFFRDIAKLWYLFWPLLLVPFLGAIDREARRKVLLTWFGTLAVLSLIGIIQHWTGWPRPQMVPGTPRYHATLFLGHHLSVASILIFPFFAALDFFRRAWSSGRWKGRSLGLSTPLWLGLIVIALITLIFTQSRMLWGALPIGLVFWALLSLPRKWSAGLIGILVLATVGASRLPAVQLRFQDSFGIWTRQELWKANLEFARERPLTGVGWQHNQELAGYYLLMRHPGEYIFVGHAHNNLIDMLGGTGVLGTLTWLVWCLFVIGLAWAWRKVPSEYSFATGLVCAWIVFHLNGLTQVNFWEGKVTHQIMWVTAWALLGLTRAGSESRA